MDSLERFAQIRAAIEQGGDRARVLRDEGLAPAAWIALQRQCLDALAAEIANGGDTLAMRYCVAFEAAQSVLRPANGPATETATPRLDDATMHVPSYLKAPSTLLPVPAPAAQPVPAAAAASPAGNDLRETVLSFEVPRMPAVPFKQGPAFPISPPAPKAATSPSIPGGTVLALDIPRGPAMPFEGSKPAAVGSVTVGAPGASSEPATPLEAVEPEVMGFNLMRYSDLVAACAEPGADVAAVLAELGIDAETHGRIEAFWWHKFSQNGVLALEFGRLVTQAQNARAEKRAPKPAAPVGRTVLALDTASTQATPFGAPREPAGSAIPFEVLDADAMGFNLVRYAHLVAARSEPSADMAAVLAEFGIDAGTHDQIEAYWRRRFVENGLLALEFGRLNAQAKKARADRRMSKPTASVGTGTSLAVDVPRAAMPFAVAAKEAPAPELTVDQYAWIVASLRKSTDVPATLALFRLTLESRKELEARWAKRMAADPALRETFLAALGRHMAGGAG